MFNEERDSPQFDWNQLGDIIWGRPILGSRTTVMAYRLMQFTLRDAMIRHVGVELANRIFYEAGQQAGKAMYQQLAAPEDFTHFVQQLTDLLEEQSIGLLKVEKADLDNNRFTLTVAEDLDCSGLPESNEMLCTFDEGLLAGLFAAYLGDDFMVKETDCWCTGDRVCRFEVKPVKAP
ncbi:V4R domain-containing protein [Desulfurivibrio alkaliphilus]|uniref:4-vinyl reductase 4VR n=1 Tax=Desulfurivibrio alkaliphilus (strain DSM 19089 / UNIQEM U267 / AHT2) TaxID=589865 RepID=D6Z1Y1_DESAT|nr:V4R domain-containing protein [Desulfurivibrio alkaliphilus]ADH85556.1 4-vinyl reductase 4VR [Desulfurivibrio alkaliphilus AHT 2]